LHFGFKFTKLNLYITKIRYSQEEIMDQTIQLYSLNEAAKELGFKPEEILDAALNRKIELLVSVPYGYDICLSSGKTDTPDYYIHPLMSVPTLLVLEQSHCSSLKSENKKALISDVSKGYSVKPDNAQLREFLPQSYFIPELIFPVTSLNPWTVWHINKSGSEDPLEVTWENVRIAKIEIDRILRIITHVFALTPERISEAYEIIGLKDDIAKYLEMEWVSVQLVQMIETARELWGNKKVIPDVKSTHPKASEVEKYLIEKYKFTQGVAKKAASILRPGFAEKGRPLDE
jgi:hypothetical protein